LAAGINMYSAGLRQESGACFAFFIVMCAFLGAYIKFGLKDDVSSRGSRPVQGRAARFRAWFP
jgi:hypothetical protein